MRKVTFRKNRQLYYGKNKLRLFIMLLAAASGIICGILLVSHIGGEQSAKLTELLKNSFTNIQSKSKTDIFFSVLKKNVRNTALVMLGSLSVWLIPVLFINLFSVGFSIGFTGGFVTAYFGFNGFLITLSLVATQIVFTVPVTMLFSSTAMECALCNKKSSNTACGENRKKMLLLCVLMMIILTALSLADVFAVPAIIDAVS